MNQDDDTVAIAVSVDLWKKQTTTAKKVKQEQIFLSSPVRYSPRHAAVDGSKLRTLESGDDTAGN
jgi:hypothetical protein